MRTSRARASRGFSTVEMLVTVAILVALAGLAMLSYGALDRAFVRAEAGEVAVFLSEARQRAAESGTPQQIEFDVRTATLSAGPTVERVGRGVSLVAPEPATVWPIIIQPSGENGGAMIDFVRGEARARVRLDWLTGRVELQR